MKETKKITTVYVPVEISEFCEVNNINLSEWIRSRFTDEFLSISGKVRELEFLSKRIEEVKLEIKKIKDSLSVVVDSLSVDEVAFLKSVPGRLKNGGDIQSVRRLFIVEFGRRVGLAEFEQLYRFVNNSVLL